MACKGNRGRKTRQRCKIRLVYGRLKWAFKKLDVIFCLLTNTLENAIASKI
jgi:hypothetical protein